MYPLSRCNLSHTELRGLLCQVLVPFELSSKNLDFASNVKDFDVPAVKTFRSEMLAINR